MQKSFRFSSIVIYAAVIFAMLSGCTPNSPENGPRGKSYFTYFDTVSYVYSYANDSAERFEDRSAAVSSILMEYHRLFDIYHEYSGVSNLCTLNARAGGDWVGLDRKLIDFLVRARDLYYLTDGEMNIMMGSVLSLWHSCAENAKEDPKNARIPSPAELDEAALHTDIGLLEIDKENCRARITDPEASADVGAVGKGYAVEMAAKYLEEDGAEGYVLDVGGNIRMVGAKPGGDDWTVGIRNPDENSDANAVNLRLSDTSCVTSGTYERYFTVDGKQYHHIIDKDTLFPSAYFESLSVITKDSALADCLSTALFCMPYEEGLALAEKSGAEAIWIFPDGTLKYTPGAKDLILEQN